MNVIDVLDFVDNTDDDASETTNNGLPQFGVTEQQPTFRQPQTLLECWRAARETGEHNETTMPPLVTLKERYPQAVNVRDK